MQRVEEHQDRHVVHVIRKGPRQEIRFSVSTYRGRRFVDVRTFLADRERRLVPTRQGFTLPPERLGELEDAVRELRAAVDSGAAPEAEWPA